MNLNSANIIIRLSALGDIVLTSAFCNELAKKKPGTIYYITQDMFIDLIEKSFIPEITIFSVKKKTPWKLYNWFAQGKNIFKQIQAENLEIDEINIYDLHNVLKSKLITAGIKWQALKHRKNIFIKLKKVNKMSLDRWKAIFLKIKKSNPEFIFQQQLRLLGDSRLTFPRLKANLKENSSAVKTILIAPQASLWKKFWPQEYWYKLIEKIIHQSEYNILLVGMDNAFPAARIEKWTKNAGKRLINTLGKLKIHQLPDVAATANLTLCSNSAWQHISEAVGVQVISLAGPIDKSFGFSPWNTDSIELSPNIWCHPCSRHGKGICYRSKKNHHACMKKVTPEILFNHVVKCLKEKEQH